MNIDLTQAEADALLALPKRCADEQAWDYPRPGEAVSIPLLSVDRRESFLLDLRRGRIDLAKGTYQNRARHVVVLARLDFGGAPHRNPDGQEIDSPHLHIYREGFGDKGPFRCRRTGSRTCRIRGRSSRISWSTAMSSSLRRYVEDCSRDWRREGSPGYLLDLAAGEDAAA